MVKTQVTLKSLKTLIFQLVKVSPYRTLVRLTPLQRFALRSRLVLLMHGGQDVPVLVFQRSYEARFAEPINPETFGFRALLGLVRAASHVLYIKGRSVTATVTVNRNFLGLFSRSFFLQKCSGYLMDLK